jgi:transcriptional regulator with XRE-family HTH domain
MLITPGQCRAARALLGWSQRDLEVKAKVSRKAIADFEREVSAPYARTIRDIVETLEAAGIEFQMPEEGVRGPGVGLKWGVEIALRSQDYGETEGRGEGGIKALEGAEDMAAYWAERQELWASFSLLGRQALSVEMYGDPYAADEAFGNDAR